MSSLHNHIPPLQVRESGSCMCEHGAECSSFAPGHALHLIQTRLASATPSDWLDAIVEAADPSAGVIVVRTFSDDLAVTLWNGAGAAATVTVGSPVALHAKYHVLAQGVHRFNVRTAASQHRI